ncbi:MAG: hypothetical protein HETSPECPRED_002601 [Heterodermia speciosa]|uniref:Uncharacterized protein n=1 Tax=Heterodermia speciosa TaxID=116794 RepID=A0A8H3F283_9LECA|nr:MAG: hypothetical protein HETSPECPRED_002601 [Heterodermia speciosa]
MSSQNSASGLADPGLLEKIDKLFACKVGEYVDLPQLVVVGDQSSGKSSVLEALTNLPFPRESTLCTRFATQITFRRSPETTVAASVIPSSESSEDHQKTARDWKKEDLQQLDSSTFASIMEEVNGIMEFKADSYGVQSQFSNDVLRLEISGPNQEHLSVIDVPGLFQRHKEGVTTKADIELVKRMVYGYMNNPRSVMLTVIPANVDIATQGILEKAEEFDSEGNRTLGVLTKPDLVDRGAEHNVVNLITDREHPLRLGWHLLRNAGQSELANSIASRQQAERDFFNTVAPWNELARDKVGINSFRSKLQEVLSDHIRREFPKVKTEISRRLKASTQALRDLGTKRQTPTEQYQYLIGISMEFQKVVVDALATNYGRHEMFKDLPSLRLVTAAVNRSETMATMFAKDGHTYHFADEAKAAEDASSDIDVDLGDLFESNAAPDQSVTTSVRQYRSRTAIDDLLPSTSDVAKPRRGKTFDWLRRVYRESRGYEIGTVNPTLLASIMKEQARKWGDIALGYIADIIVLTHTFIEDLLREICPTRRVRDGILSLLMDQLCTKYKAAIKHVVFLLSVDRDGTPSTLNHYFNDTLQKCRQKRLHNRIQSKTVSDCTHGEVVRTSDLYQHEHMGNEEHTIQDLHDVLESYYKVSRKTFVDNLRKQVGDHFLISGPDTPLTLFSPAFVSKLTHEELEEAVGEDRQLKRRRADLEKETKDLEEAMKILR